MPTPQVTTTTTQQNFPSGTPTGGTIRYELRVASTLQVIQTVNVAPGTNPVFTTPSDGTYIVRGQRDTGAGVIGSSVDSAPATLNSQVSLAVPATITLSFV